MGLGLGLPMLLAMMKRRQPVGSRASIRRRVPMRLCSCHNRESLRDEEGGKGTSGRKEDVK